MNKPEKILIVDDEIMMREMLYSLFSKKGYQVISAPNGEEAVKQAKESRPDLIVLDLKMPKMNGIEVLRQIREFDKDVEVVILTGIMVEDLEKRAAQLGVSEIVRKGVSVELFLKSIIQTLEKHKARQSNVPAHQPAKARIMVVDDDVDIRFVLEKFLQKHGYEVITAQSGEEALEYIEREKSKQPSLVLCDIKMPGMDGLLTIKKIKELNSKIGVVMISGLIDMELNQKAIELGAYDYIMKPFNMEYLEMVVLTKLLLTD
ncbi:MAG: response regulator [Candidatus Brocadiia bacterium]